MYNKKNPVNCTHRMQENLVCCYRGRGNSQFWNKSHRVSHKYGWKSLPSLSYSRRRSRYEADFGESVISFISSSDGYLRCKWSLICELFNDKTSSMYLNVRLNIFASVRLPCLIKFWTNSASYKYKNRSARSGAQFVPIGIPRVCWKILPPKSTNMLSIRKSITLVMSSSVYLVALSERLMTKYVLFPLTTRYW